MPPDVQKTNPRLRNNLAQLLAKHKMKQNELSRITGIRPATINMYYHEKVSRMRPKDIIQFCQVFNCGVNELFYIESAQNDANLITKGAMPDGSM